MAVESFPTMTVPLRIEPSDAVRAFRPELTRINLATIVLGYKDGETPQEIHRRLPTVDLADIYLVIAYYLQNTAEVDAYLRAEVEERKRAEADRKKFNRLLWMVAGAAGANCVTMVAFTALFIARQ